MKKLSVVVPCYNEEECIQDFYLEVEKQKKFFEEKNICFEYIFVDDGSSDQTLDEIKKLNSNDDSVRFVSFSRNFGKEAGLLCGLEEASGDYVTVMDVDLQDPPSLLPEMFAYLDEGYDVVGTRRVSRKGEPVIRSFFARRFYRFINKRTEAEIVDGARDFRLMKRQVVDAILQLPENNRFSKGIFGWVGFKTKWIEFENVERKKGETKWSFWKLVLYSIEGITSFSNSPLVFSAFIGLLFCVISFIAIIFIIIRTLVFGDPVGGWPSLVCIISLVSGVQLFCIGIVGQYTSKIYFETKNRPKYIVREKNVKESDKDEK
jgi:glycosyltransferase involved in cell wall biosynthesis